MTVRRVGALLNLVGSIAILRVLPLGSALFSAGVLALVAWHLAWAWADKEDTWTGTR